MGRHRSERWVPVLAIVWEDGAEPARRWHREMERRPTPSEDHSEEETLIHSQQGKGEEEGEGWGGVWERHGACLGVAGRFRAWVRS